MSYDLEAIRKRMEELSGLRKTSNVQMWKPELGDHRIRCLPLKNSQEGQPFLERWFYYLGNTPGVLAPKQFGKPDPIAELISKLYNSGKPEDRALAKQLSPKMRVFAPIIVKGQEDKGPQVWSFGKLIYQRLLGFFLDEDYGDITNVNEGYDLKVTITQQPGKQFKDTVVDCKGKPSKLHENPEVVQKWLDQVPDIDDMYRLKSYEEIEKILYNYINGDVQPDVESTGLVKSAGETKSEETSFSSLDDAFAELMNND